MLPQTLLLQHNCTAKVHFGIDYCIRVNNARTQYSVLAVIELY